VGIVVKPMSLCLINKDSRGLEIANKCGVTTLTPKILDEIRHKRNKEKKR